MPPKPPPPPPDRSRKLVPDSEEDDSERDDSNRRDSEPDQTKASPSQTIHVESVADNKAKLEEEEERKRKEKEEEDLDKKPCCTAKCALMPLLIFGYFLLFIFIIVGLCLSLAFIIVHGVFRFLHIMFWGVSLMRNSVNDVLDVERLQEEHERSYKNDMKEWEHRQKMKEHDKNKAAAERQRKGLKPKKMDSSDSDDPAPAPNMRVCSPSCVGKSSIACLGMTFNGTAYVFFVLAFMFGFAAISIFTSIFPSCTLGGVNYLSEFRKKYDVDLAGRTEAAIQQGQAGSQG